MSFGRSFLSELELVTARPPQQHNTEIFNVGQRRRFAANMAVPPNNDDDAVEDGPTKPEQAAAILLNGAPTNLEEPSGFKLEGRAKGNMARAC